MDDCVVENWKNLLKKATELNCHISLQCTLGENADLFPDAWKIIEPYVEKIQFLYLEQELIKSLAELLECKTIEGDPEPKSEEWCKQCCELYNKIKGPIICTSFVNEGGESTEFFSLMCQGKHSGTTKDIPVYAKVIDKRGVISGFMCGIIDCIISHNITVNPSGDGYNIEEDLIDVCRHGDILSAFSQLSKGEQIEYKRGILNYFEAAYFDIPLLLNVDAKAVDNEDVKKKDEEHVKRMNEVKEVVEKAKICPSIKVGNLPVYINRIKQLSEKKLKMFSVHIQSPNLANLLKAVRETIPKDDIIGLYNVTSLKDLVVCIQLGIDFIVCPFEPTFDFISEAHKLYIIL